MGKASALGDTSRCMSEAVATNDEVPALLARWFAHHEFLPGQRDAIEAERRRLFETHDPLTPEQVAARYTAAVSRF